MIDFDAVPLRDGQGVPAVAYQASFLTEDEVCALTSEVSRCSSHYRSSFMQVGDRWVKMPRLSAEYGEIPFTYADTWLGRNWLPVLDQVRSKLEMALDATYNYAIANWYRTGIDFTGWHADKMELHVPGSHIAMVSVGATRRLSFRSEVNGAELAAIDVQEGSLLVMFAASQDRIEHSVRPDDSISDRRVSFTFRQLQVASNPVCDCRGGRR